MNINGFAAVPWRILSLTPLVDSPQNDPRYVATLIFMSIVVTGGTSAINTSRQGVERRTDDALA